MMHTDDLIKLLQELGTAEIGSDGNPMQVTQALSENEQEVQYMIFGDLKKSHIKPIDEVCKKCHFWKSRFPSTNDCQKRQKRDAELRGFKGVVCPNQLED